MRTVKDVIATDGNTSGFDYLRLFLAVAVIFWHSIVVTHEPKFIYALTAGPWRPAVTFILPMFFALSGFLVTGSLLRTRSLTEFLLLRAIRIFPALTVEIVLSGFILGPLVTTVPLVVYFTDHDFFKYLLNVVGRVHMVLPGVFQENVKPNIVNVSLWTIPYELECYIAISIFFLMGLTRARKALFVPLLTLLILIFTATTLLWGWNHVVTDGPIMGRSLVVAFLVGSAIYLHGDRVPISGGLAVCALLAFLVLLWWEDLAFIAAVPGAYLTVYLGLLNPRKMWFVRTGDYSYGLYLFAFPIQQLVVLMFSNNVGTLMNFVLSMLLASAYAAFSWHAIERPILSTKRKLISAVEDVTRRMSRQTETA